MTYAYILAGTDVKDGGGIYSYAVKEDGGLAKAAYLPLMCPMYAAVDGGYLYVVCRHVAEGPNRFGREADSAVTKIELLPDGGLGGPSPMYPTEGITGCHIDLLKKDGGSPVIYTANYSSAVISRLSPCGDGYVCDAVVTHGDPDKTHGRFDGKAYLHQCPITPDGGHVCAVDLGRDEVAVYDTDLRLVSVCALKPGTGPRHIIFRGEDAYTVNELTSTACSYKWDAGKGTLTYTGIYDLLPEGATDEYRLSCSGAAIRICGDVLYTSTRLDNSICSFDIAEDGSLKKKQYIKCGGNWPRDINVTPDGRYLYSANEREGSVTVFTIEDGMLSPIGAAASVPSPNNIVFA